MKFTIITRISLFFQRIGWKFILKRILSSLLTVFIIMTIVFFMMRVLPGDAFQLEKELPEEIKKKWEERFHLNEPLINQYFLYVSNIIFRLDFGTSTTYYALSRGQETDNSEIILKTLPISIPLAFYTIVFSIIIGIILGMLAAKRQNKFIDGFTVFIVILGISTPPFVILPLLVLLFSNTLHLLPPKGWGSVEHFVIPILTLSLPVIAWISKLTKAGIIENYQNEFVMTARAKGLSERKILLKHVLKGSLIPAVTYLGPAFASIITGSVIVERIYGIPGMGRLFLTAVGNRDYLLFTGVMIVYSSIIVFMNLIVDIIYAFLDPRIKYS